MKKTLRTVITAAMFAAANLAALPAAAEELKSDEQSSFEGVSQSEFNKWEDITGQMGQMFYGPAPNYDLNDHSNDWKQTTTTADDDEKTTTTTTSMAQIFAHLTTTTIPIYDQPLYGAPTPKAVQLERFGDLNMDGNVDSFDMIALRKLLVNGYIKGVDYYDAVFNGDVNHDNKVSIADLIMLQKYLLGQVNDLKTGNTEYGNVKLEWLSQTTTTKKRDHHNEATTTTSLYDPREDIVVSLYGIKPAKDIIDQAIWQTKDNIDINLSSEDEK
ncbi:dockerin type I repeat-containing protein [uncultured Ruminococcus sp.]|uniref:dockerin type I repeat-containing protein n=1 Tax=uncultured Ruminococcus sp. TaxID=165186 RepID=UPI0025D824A6|nr:dockerin type I repeat-containing protein [uncultured Ruminococcus sp.]